MNQDFQKQYRAFIEGKFGKFVTDELLSENLFLTIDPKKQYEKGQKELKEHLKKLEINGLSKETIDQNEMKWGFDFPGWVGNLTENGKEIMVIGMEPHIEDCDFQATYGLFELQEEFPSIAGNLWERLFALFGNPSETMKSRLFLERFYLTDMCHFAYRGKAKLIQEVSNWKAIREAAANRFLETEIELVKPSIVITQGRFPSDWLERHLKSKHKILRWRPTKNNPWREEVEPLAIPDAYKYLPRFIEYENSFSQIIHLALPHLGTGLTNTFWKKEKMKECLRSEIEDFCKLPKLA